MINWACRFALRHLWLGPARKLPLTVIAKYLQLRYVLTGRIDGL